MVSKRLGIYGLISAAALVSGVLVGCGGSSASVQGASPVVVTTGGITNTSGAGPAGGVTSSSAPQQVQVTLSSGATVTGTLPAGETIPAGGTIATIPAGVPIIQGLTLGPKFHGGHSAPATGGQGEVWVDGTNTGLTVDSSGSLSGVLILVTGAHTIHAQGPFSIVTGIQQLGVGQFNFGVVVLADGNASIPVGLNLRLPSNGGTLANGNYVTVTYPTPDFAAGSGSLFIGYSGITVTKTLAMQNGVATYNQLTPKTSSAIPQGGVDNVTFNYHQ